MVLIAARLALDMAAACCACASCCSTGSLPSRSRTAEPSCAGSVLQEKCYWALALPHGWWLFGLDLALSEDIDICQCRCAGRYHYI